jgi:hypothetical protein
MMAFSRLQLGGRGEEFQSEKEGENSSLIKLAFINSRVICERMFVFIFNKNKKRKRENVVETTVCMYDDDAAAACSYMYVIQYL